MDTNAQNTVVTVFQHVEIFFTMLDHYSANSKSVVGFQIAAYESVTQAYLKKYVDKKTDKQRIAAALSLKNMDACDLISFVDHRRGQFGLHRGLLQTIQGLDSKRIRELGQPDLDIIYVQLQNVSNYFISAGRAFDRSDPQFQENLATLFDVLQDTLSKIDHNARALEGSSKRLSEILESHDFNQMVISDQVQNALDEVIRISKQNIKPSLTFLNEKAMTPQASAMYLLRRIRESFERTTFHAELANITTIEMKLLSYAEVIATIRRRLNCYVEMDRKSREIYNGIEKRFNQLYASVVSRLDTKLKGKKLPASDPIFNPSRAMSGLVNWNATRLTAPLVHLPKGDTSQHLNEHIRTKLAKAEAVRSIKRNPTQLLSTAKERFEKDRRIKRIQQTMKCFDVLLAKYDLYLAVHEHLSAHLPSYELKDIYDALPFVDKRATLRSTFTPQSIIHHSKRLTYLVKQLEVANHE